MAEQSIVISPVYGAADTQRLHFFAGRSLSQQEFALMQRYVDERCEDLLVARQPGIVYGLEVLAPRDKNELTHSSWRINPGLGVSWSGRVVSNRTPIHLRWNELRDEYLARTAATGEAPLANLPDGFYFLTLRRQVRVLDELKKTDPCTRTELDPLRDTRVATLAQLNLQPLPFASGWMALSRQRVAMRVFNALLVAHPLTQPLPWENNPLAPEDFPDPDAGVFAAENPHEVKLALVKINAGEPEWVDAQAGRLLARENAVQLAMLDYWHSILKAPARFRLDGAAAEIAPEKNLQELLDLDYLPAAGKFPEQLISNIAGKVSQVDFTQWQRPALQFAAHGLQIEIVPVPANSVLGVVRQELARGVIDLSGADMDRIRLMVAVNPDDYHPQLFNLPEIDKTLVKDDLAKTQYQAYLAYKTWAEAYWNLYFKIEVRAPKKLADLTLKTKAIFSSLYISHIPHNAFPDLTAERSLRRELAIPDISPKPQNAAALLRGLKIERCRELGFPINNPFTVDNKKLPRPWSLCDQVIAELKEEPYSDPLFPAGDGLIAQRIDTREDIEEIEQFIVRTNQLIDEVRDYLSSQRQQLDSITVSFSSLAGGIPGDGTGLKLFRLSDKLKFTTSAVVKTTES